QPVRPAEGDLLSLLPQQPANRLPVAAPAVGLQGVRCRTRGLEQGTRPAVPALCLGFAELVQHRALEVVPEGLVVPESPRVLDGHGEDLPPLQLLQARLASLALQELVAQARREPAQHASAQQELAEMWRQVIQ